MEIKGKMIKRKVGLDTESEEEQYYGLHFFLLAGLLGWLWLPGWHRLDRSGWFGWLFRRYSGF